MKSWLMIALGLGIAVADISAAKLKGITTLAELADYAVKSGNSIKMKPGVYQLEDLLPDEAISRMREEAISESEKSGSGRQVSLFEFSGHDPPDLVDSGTKKSNNSLFISSL